MSVGGRVLCCEDDGRFQEMSQERGLKKENKGGQTRLIVFLFYNFEKSFPQWFLYLLYTTIPRSEKH